MPRRVDGRWRIFGTGLALAFMFLDPSSPVEAAHCVSARASVQLQALAPEDCPVGYQDPTDHCFAGTLRGPVKGNLVVCMPESECALDTNLCTCSPSSGLWAREGEGGAMAYRARVWLHGAQGGFEAIERGIQVENTVDGSVSTLDVTGLFVAIGHQPNTDLFKGQLAMEDTGYLVTQPDSSYTDVDGVFACGDVQDHTYRQAITAAGSGCMAAIDAERWLEAHGH